LNYLISHIARLLKAEPVTVADTEVKHLLFDSRKVFSPDNSLFFALKGPRRNGHHFISDLYDKGVKNFVVSEKPDAAAFPKANFIQVDDTLAALQLLAAHHRKQFNVPVIGITGSNGKTIVKEWLYQLLQEDYNIVRSPKSFNSQIGVPLSVWQMNEEYQLAIFEAGISGHGEMEKLEQIIQPSIGVLTNIGEAHNEGFGSRQNKLFEKMKLFSHCELIVANADDEAIYTVLKNSGRKLFLWGSGEKADVKVTDVKKETTTSEIFIRYNSSTIIFSIPFTDDASVENAITCATALLALKTDPEIIKKRMPLLHPVNMRLELKKGINHCTIINDSYSADLSSLHIALNFLQQQGSGTKTIILSDLLQSGINEEELYRQIGLMVRQHGVNRLIGIGDKISHHLAVELDNTGIQQDYFLRTESFLHQFRFSQFRDETILVKGARQFGFEDIVHLLEQKVHQTVLEINLNAIVHNLREFQKLLKPSTKVMAMVKAFAYGSGGAEIAGVLQYHKVDYLGVAYADEGVELRKAGITLPVMVMNPEVSTFEVLTEYNLEPEIYSFSLLTQFDQFLKQEGIKNYPIHLELETGMNRLGFAPEDIIRLAEQLRTTSSFKVQSFFTHLVASEDAVEDKFSFLQFTVFNEAAEKLQSQLGYRFNKHISNSAAILRHPKMEMDMVRLGIGLYGVDSSGAGKLRLEPVATLRSTVAQVKHLKKGDTVSYNRRGKVKKDSVIATIRIGYADGYPRRLGNGEGKVWLRGKLVPVIGTVCMDMIMVDITDIPGIKEGDTVIIFGKELSIQQLADWAGTIPYEIMTGISQRVKRVYFEE
jgi:alanine racemase